jgi:MFS family permease
LGSVIAADLKWDTRIIFGGFSIGLATMGLCSGPAGRLVDRHGGRATMAAGGIINAVGCVMLASAHTQIFYIIAWIVTGVGMRLSLYDAAFATLARMGGGADRAMAQITLFGGLSSTVFWPAGYYLAEVLGWRGAILVYAAFALITVALVFLLPENRPSPQTADRDAAAPRKPNSREVLIAALCYSAIATLHSFLLAGLTSHILVVLHEIGASAAVAVSAASLQGIGQFTARFAQVFFARKTDPLRLGIYASGLLVLSFAAALFGAHYTALPYAFMLLFGAGNGLLTIVKGTLPLLLFSREVYGASVGRLVAPGFILAAAAPTIYAQLIQRFPKSALYLSAGAALGVFAIALALSLMFHKQRLRARTA